MVMRWAGARSVAAWGGFLLVVGTPLAAQGAPPEVLHDCDSTTGWNDVGTTATDPVEVGTGSLRWAVADGDRLEYTPAAPIDMTQHDALALWIHANHPHALGGNVLVYLGSEDAGTDGADYYFWQLPIDWTGWRRVELEREYFHTSRSPRGWDQIDSISLIASGWDNTADPTLILHVDDVSLVMVDRTAPKTTDAELFAALDLTLPGLETVRAAVDGGDLAAAKTALAAYYRARTEPTWFFDPHTIDPSVGYDETRATNAVNATFDIVGTTYTFPGGVIDWSYNPTLDGPAADNNEWTWQLGRMSFWNDLGRAYWSTGDAVYAQAFADQLASFVTTRRVPTVAANGAGSSWRTIDTGIRASGSWSDAWFRFLEAPAFDDEHLFLMLKSFYEHGAYLRQFQTSGNWLTHELDGLYTVGAMFPELREAAEWRTFAAEQMYAAMAEQFLPDGGHYELSPGYHQVSIAHITGLYEVAEVTGHASELPSDYLTRLETAYLWPIQIATPDWNNPAVNDSWDVDVARASELPATLFVDEPLFAWAASGRATGTPPAWLNLLLPDSGLVVLRSSWSEDAHYALLDVGPWSRGHSHQDKLNLIVYAGGRRLLFDNGGGNYETSAYRDYGLDTHSHNTVLVDGLPQERARDEETDPLGWGNPATPATHFHTQATHAYAVSYYADGYGELDQRLATHRRELLYVKPDLFVVVDTMTPGDGTSHTYEARWHLATTSYAEAPASVTLTTDAGLANLAIAPLATAGLTVLHASGVTDPEVLGWDLGHSGGYEPALTVRHQRTGTDVQRFVTLLVPLAPGEGNPIASTEATSDREFRVELVDGTTLELTLAEGPEPGIQAVLDTGDGDPVVILADPTQSGTEYVPPGGVGGAGPGSDGTSGVGASAADGSRSDGGCGCATVHQRATGSLVFLLGVTLLAARRRRSGLTP